jgi:hypothetical protein
MINNFQHRQDMCDKFANFESTELGDAIGALTTASRVLYGISSDFEAEISLLLAENLCRRYVEHLRSRQCDWDEYNEFPEDLFSYFLGGAKKLTKEKYTATR